VKCPALLSGGRCDNALNAAQFGKDTPAMSFRQGLDAASPRGHGVADARPLISHRHEKPASKTEFGRIAG
jgi:hypothetical protein